MLADEAKANNEAAARPWHARHSFTDTASARAVVAPFLTPIAFILIHISNYFFHIYSSFSITVMGV